MDKGVFFIWYEFGLRKIKDEMIHNIEENVEQALFKAEIFDEILSYSFESENEKIRKNVLIDTRTTDVFLPKTKYLELVGDKNTENTELLVNKKYKEIIIYTTDTKPETIIDIVIINMRIKL